MSKNLTPYVARGNQRSFAANTRTTFNIDNGAATTADDASIGPFPFACHVIGVRAVYTQATDTAGAASANFKVGVSAGDDSIVAATALEVSKAIGAYTQASIVSSYVPANTTIWTRHTGVAVTEVGEYFVQAIILPVP